MTLNIYNHFTASQAMSHLTPRHKSQMAVAFVGKPLFNFGNIHFQNTKDLKDRLIAETLKARVSHEDVRLVISPTFAAVSCVDKESFAKMMGVVQDKPHQQGIWTVQVTQQNTEWHHRAFVDFILPANTHLRNSKSSMVKIVPVTDQRRDYVFPTHGSMMKFCRFIETKLPAEGKFVEQTARLG